MLRPGGRIAYYTIHVTPGLSPRAYRSAVRSGPPEVGSSRDASTMLTIAGFADVAQVDVTKSFLEICRAIRRARDRYADRLRVEEGEVEFEEEQEKKRCSIEGIEGGLLRRSLLLGSKPQRAGRGSRQQRARGATRSTH